MTLSSASIRVGPVCALLFSANQQTCKQSTLFGWREAGLGAVFISCDVLENQEGPFTLDSCKQCEGRFTAIYRAAVILSTGLALFFNDSLRGLVLLCFGGGKGRLILKISIPFYSKIIVTYPSHLKVCNFSGNRRYYHFKTCAKLNSLKDLNSATDSKPLFSMYTGTYCSGYCLWIIC